MQGVITEQKSERQQVVVFQLAGEHYCVEIHWVREIIRIPEVTRVPEVPDFMEGVINLRGRVTPILDLRRRFGFKKDDEAQEKRILIIEVRNQTMGLIVDGVSEVLDIERSAIDPPSPYLSSIHSQYIAGIAKLEDRLLIQLNVGKVLSDDELEHLEQSQAYLLDLDES